VLRSLQIRDYALIEELDVRFDGGLNVITGETGAGKSILIGALKALLGERVGKEVIRKGTSKAVIEGVFDEVDSPRIREILAQNEIDGQPFLIIRREIAGSSSRAFINDTPATAATLRDVAANLIDLHGQHEHQSLLRKETHIELIDAFGNLSAEGEAYRKAYRTVSNVIAELERLRAREKELRDQRELYEFQVNEIDEVAPSVDEENRLESELKLLENAERLADVAAGVHESLYEADGSAVDLMGRAAAELGPVSELDPKLGEILEEVRSARIMIEEATAALQTYAQGLEFDADRLEEIRERLSDVDRLKKKYGGSVAAVLAHRENIGKKFDTAVNFEGAITRLERARENECEVLSRAAFALSEGRRKVSRTIETAIVAELGRLGIEHSRFEIRFDRTEDEDGWVWSRWEGANAERFAALPDGIDEAEFYITTNVGEDLKPLVKVASGGEVSRIMLALKRILASNEAFPILVFDEIDNGISGAVSAKVAESMHDLGRKHQIICITHLPQIAARADSHFAVEKTVAGHRTRTSIRRLSERERAEEVATLMSGSEITEASLRNARELMSGFARTV
jgi:DNA repair protein RecN (Recombination protein N)